MICGGSRRGVVTRSFHPAARDVSKSHHLRPTTPYWQQDEIVRRWKGMLIRSVVVE